MTDRPSNVRTATPEDEQNVLKLMRRAYQEQPIFKLNEDKMLKMIQRATQRTGGILGVIDGPNGLEGYLLCVLSQHWYTDDWVVDELSNFVDPDHRRSSHAKNLIEFGKWFAEQMHLPLIMGILSTKRTEAKIRLYRRQVRPCGGIFVHNTGHLSDALSEMG